MTLAPLWEVGAPPPDDVVRALAADLSLPRALCAVLAARGLSDPADARRHLRPRIDDLAPPGALADAEAAVDRLCRALDAGETVLVHGDYDVDGICATALLTRVLRALGGTVVPFVPHRLRDGYDLGAAGLERAREAGASLLLTADCGTVAHDAVAEARAGGMDVIVTDHHTPGDTLPDAVAVVNPAREDDPTDTPLSGAGVAFKVCQLLAERRGMPFDDLAWHLDLVAVATVADLVPLRGENRVLARYGLRVLQDTRNEGLRALLEVTGLGTGAAVDAGKVGFVLAPRINAAGRVGDADEALRLLLTGNPREARRLAEALEEHNRRRREEDRRTLDEALEMLEDGYDPERDHGVVLARQGWHPGVIGIVASRVVERIHRPTVLVALDGGKGRGSARSIPGFHLYDAVRACREHLRRFGGHRMAAGMDLDADAVPAFREAFRAEARERLEGQELRPRLRVDVELPAGDPLDGVDLRFSELLEYLGPHGIGNPRPVFLARGLEVAGRPRVVGRGHLKLGLRRNGHTVDAIGFDLAERLERVAGAGAPLDAVFQIRPHEYRGRRSVQARLLDLRPAGEGDEDGGGRADRTRRSDVGGRGGGGP